MADVVFTVTPQSGAYVHPIDKTLKVQGAAADSKAVGDAIDALEADMALDLESAVSTLNGTITNNKNAASTADSALAARLTKLEGNASVIGSVKQNINSSLEDFKPVILALAYPVGSVYMSTESTSPATLFGGTWERIKGRFLFGGYDEDDEDEDAADHLAGATGGAYTHTHTTPAVALTTAQLPAHTHGEVVIDGKFNMAANAPVRVKSTGYNEPLVECNPIYAETDTDHTTDLNCFSAGNKDGRTDTAEQATAASSSERRYSSGHGDLHTTKRGNNYWPYVGKDEITMKSRHTHESVGTGATHAHGDTGSTSSMPPYLAVYVWKRVS